MAAHRPVSIRRRSSHLMNALLERFRDMLDARPSGGSQAGRRRCAAFEPLEPKILLSADLLPGVAVSMTDGDGTLVTIRLEGPGHGLVEQDETSGGDGGLRLTLQGTDGGSALKIDAVGGDGRFAIDAIRVEGSLGKLLAGAGVLTGALDVDDALGVLALGQLADGSVRADSLGTLNVSGDFSGLLELRGAVSGLTLSSATIGGELDGRWNVQGRTGAVRAANTSDTWFAAFAAPVSSITTTGDFAGTLYVRSLLQLTVGGDLRQADLIVGASVGADGQLGGAGADADSFGPGNLNRVRINGNLAESEIRVGVDPVNGVFDDGDDQILSSSRIQELLIGGDIIQSTVVTGILPTQVRVHGALVSTSDVAGIGSAARDEVVPVLSARLAEDTGASATDGLTRVASVTGQLADVGGPAKLSGDLGNGFFDVSGALGADGRFTLDAAALASILGRALEDGRYRLDLKGEDRAGNESAVVEIAFELDTRPPSLSSFDLAVTSDSGTAGDGETDAARVVLIGAAETGASLELVGLEHAAQAGEGGVFQFADVALTLGSNTLTARATDQAGNRAERERTFVRTPQGAQDAALAWNDEALQAVKRDGSIPAYATRALAMVSLAIYDVVNAIEGTPGFYVTRTAAAGTRVDAAVAQVARDILTYLYPAQQALFDAKLAATLATIADPTARVVSVGLGHDIAERIIAVRSADGWKDFAEFPGGTELGKWRPTGPMFDVAQLPQWADLTPFALSSPSEFRPSPPPSLTSELYAASVEETRMLGRSDSAERTAEQTQIALFWADGAGTYTPPGHWNQIALQIARSQGNSLTANARLFALLNVALADASIAAWDAKYEYGLWRPITAIANAADDGNPTTTFEAGWRPLLLTPNHPEYPSGHSTYSAAAAAVLTDVFGDDVAFSTDSAGLPGVNRAFDSFDQAAQEAGRSRIYGGIHFEFTNQVSLALGRQVGANAIARFNLAGDEQAPTVLLNDSSNAVNANITLTGSVLDSLSGVESLTVTVDSGIPTPLVPDENGQFQFQTGLALDGSADGTHTFRFATRDRAGNEALVARQFTLDTRPPEITLGSLAEGAAIDASARLTGTANPTGSTIVSLAYDLDGGAARTLLFDSATGSFDAALSIGNLTPGAHTLTLSARDAAGNTASVTRQLSLPEAIPLTITRVTPTPGSSEVGTTFRPQIHFSRAVDIATLTADSLFATAPDGAKLESTIVPAQDGTFAWLFFEEPLPGASTVTIHAQGDLIRAQGDGSALDGDDDDIPGGEHTFSFTTVSLATIPSIVQIAADGTETTISTKLVGRVVDPGPDLYPMTFDDIRRGPDGIIHTPDDVFLLPLAGVKVWILGREAHAVFTDANGLFELIDVPAGNVKLALDGRTATNAPADYFFPEMVMDIELKPGIVNTVMGGMGTNEERLANADRQEVYLPRVPTAILTTVSETGTTTVGVDAISAPNLDENQREQLTLTVAPGSLIGDDGTPIENAQIGISTVPPELVRDMLPPGLLQHTFDITIQAPGVSVFSRPAQITFPNVFNAAPGTKLNILSFDHTTGRLVINGTGTVSEDGKTVVSDEGSGVVAPGWHGVAPPGVEAKTPPKPPKPPKPPECDTVGVGLSVAGVALGAAGLALTGVASSGVLLGIGVAGVAVGVTDAVRTWSNQSSADKVQTAVGVGSAIASTGTIIASQTSPTTVSTITNVKFGQILKETVGAAESLASKVGKGFGILGTALGVKDAYTRIRDCFPGGGGATIMALSSMTTPSLAADNGFAAELFFDEFLSRREAAANAITSAFNRVFGPAISTLLPGLSQDLVFASEGTRVIFYDTSGNIVLTEDGSKLSIDLYEVVSMMDLDDPNIVSGLGEVSGALQSLADAYMFLEDADTYATSFVDDYNGYLANEVAESPISEDTPLGHVYYAISAMEGDDGAIRGITDDGQLNVFLKPSSRYVLQFYSPSADAYGSSIVTTGLSGSGALDFGVPGDGVPTFIPASPLHDSDGDGLADFAEAIVGSNPQAFSSSGDGIADFEKVLAGQSVLTVGTAVNGLLSMSKLKGPGQSVDVGPSNGNGATTVYVATGTYGVAMMDASNPAAPSILREVNLPGDSVDVAFDVQSNSVVVASNYGGLNILPADGSSRRTIGVVASQLEAFEGVVYVNSGGDLRSYDILSGERLDTLSSDASDIVALVRDGSTLYALDDTGLLRLVAVSAGRMSVRGSLALTPQTGTTFFVGGGIAYVGTTAERAQGFSTIDVSDPDNLRLISGPDAINIVSNAIAANGSGLAVTVGSITGPNGIINALDVVDVSDPADTSRFVTRYRLPSAPKDVAIGAGMAFVVSEDGSLMVVNYQSTDNKGVPPVVSAQVQATDLDPAVDGLQVQEGRRIAMTLDVRDDVQVRSVELLLNGKVVSIDLSFPFDLSVVLQTIAANGGDTVTLQARATDTGGNIGLSTPIELQLVADTIEPALVASNLTEGATVNSGFRAIRLEFSEALDPQTVSESNFVLVGPQGEVSPTSIQVRDGGKQVQLTYDVLPIGAYELRLDAASIADRAGNALGSAPQLTPFTVAQVQTRWTGPATGSWHDAANWSGGEVPQEGDDVVIPTGVTVTFSRGNDTVNSLTSAGTVVLSGGTLGVNSTSEIAGDFVFLGGTITGSGSITLKGRTTWTGGVMSGLGTTRVDGELVIDPAAGATLGLDGGRMLETRGETSWSGRVIDLNAWLEEGAGTWRNEASGVIRITGDGSLRSTNLGANDSGAGARFANSGRIERTAGSGTTLVSVAFDNSGVAVVDAGTLDLLAGGTHAGTFDIGAAAVLRLDGGVQNVSGAFAVDPSGRIVIAGATLNVGNAQNVGGEIELRSGAFNAGENITLARYVQQGGSLDGIGNLLVTDTLDWSGGLMRGTGSTVSVGELAIELEAGPAMGLDGGRTLENRGHGAISAGGFDLNAGDQTGSGHLVNAAGATLTLSGGTSISATNRGAADDGTQGTFENLGTVTFTGNSPVRTVRGFIDQPGQVNTYVFTLDEPTTLFFDGLLDSNGDHFSWSLQGPDSDDPGKSRFFGSTRNDSAVPDATFGFDTPLIPLAAGEYKLFVESFDNAIGWYGFRLLDVVHAPAPSIVPGTPVSGSLNPGFDSALYRFDAEAGQRFLFDLETDSSYDEPRWTLVDPDGRFYFQWGAGSTASTLLAQSGTWTVLVQGRRNNWAPVHYTLDIRPRQPDEPMPDLVVTSVDSKRTSDGRLQIDWTVENQGTVDATPQFGSWRDTIHASADGVIFNGNETWLGSLSGFETLGAGQSRHNQVIVDMPLGLAPGSRIFVTVDSDNNVFEKVAGEYNNNTVEAVKPTVEVTSVGAEIGYSTPSTPIGYESEGSVTVQAALKVQWTVSNLGSEPVVWASGQGWKFDVTLTDDVNTSLSYSASYSDDKPLAPGESRTYSLNRILPIFALLNSVPTYRFSDGLSASLSGEQNVTMNLVSSQGDATSYQAIWASPTNSTPPPKEPVQDSDPLLLLPVAAVAGTISAGGEVDTYSFDLASSKRIYVDSLNDSADLFWTLSREGAGVVASRTFDATDGAGIGAANPLLDLVAGRYQVTVAAVGGRTGEYDFRVIDVDAAASRELQYLGPVVRDTNSRGDETSVYQFEGTAGELFQLGGEFPIEGSAFWRLIDPTGQQIFANPGHLPDSQVFEVSGTYTLLVEGPTGRRAPSNHVLYLYAPVAHTEALNGAQREAGLDFIERPGLQNTYTFSLSKRTTAFLDGLPNSNGPYFNWFLEGPGGQVWWGDTRHDSDVLDERLGIRSPLLHLEPGDYRLRVEAFNDAIGWYDFRLVDVLESAAPVLTPGVTVVGQLNPGSSSALYRFDAEAGQRVTFDLELSGEPSGIGSDDPDWVLVDPQGRLAFLGTTAEPLSTVIDAGGTWTLLLQGRQDHAEPVNYTLGLRVRQANDPLPDLVVTSIDTKLIGGNQLQVTWTTQNRGAGDAAVQGFGTWTDSISLSIDDIPFNGDDIFLGQYVHTHVEFDPVTGESRSTPDRLAAGAERTDTIVVMRPAGLSGSYRAIVVADNENRVHEMAQGEYNNATVEDVPSGAVPPRTGSSELDLALPIANVSGRIDTPGEIDRYTLVLAEPTRLYVDSLIDGSDVFWTLKTAGGLVLASRSFATTDAFGLGAENPLLTLAAGSYEFLVDSPPGGTGDYDFRVLDIDRAASSALVLDAGPVFGARLARGDLTDVYQFEATAGTLYQVSAAGAVVENSLYVRLIDPEGVQIFASPWQGSDIRTFGVSGTYTLLVEGRIGRTDPASYLPSVYTPQDRLTPLTLGADVQGFIDSPGQINTHTFHLDSATVLFFDGFLGSNGDSYTWSLERADGTILIGNTRFDSRSLDERVGFETPFIPMDAGDYRLVVRSFSDAAGWYGFRLVDVLHSPATVLVPGTPVSGVLQPGFGSALYRLEAESGQDMMISMEARGEPNWVSGDAPTWWLVDPAGNLTLFGKPEFHGSRRIYQTGAWTLLVQGRRDHWDQVDYTLNASVQRDNDPLPDLVVTSIETQLVGPGEVEVTWTTANRGTALARGRFGEWAESVWASRDDVPFSDNDIYLGQIYDSAPLDAGAERQHTLTVSLPPDLPSGYRIFVVTDADVGNVSNEVAEKAGGEYNNTTIEDVPSGVSPTPIVSVGSALVLPRAEVGASIDVAGETDLYTFTLTAASRIYFDSLTDSADLQWALTDSAGQTVARQSFSTSDAFGFGESNPVLALAAGNYAVSVTGDEGATGAYAFRLLDVDAVASNRLQLNGGPILDGQLTRGDETIVYQFQGTAGVRYLLGGPGDQAIEGSLYWRLIDPDGQQIYATDVEPMPISTFGTTGTYTLLVEGRVGRTDPGQYNVYVFTPGDYTEAITPGAAGPGIVGVPFINVGTLEVASGRLEVAMPILGSGRITVGDNATLVLGTQTIEGPYDSSAPPAPPSPTAAASPLTRSLVTETIRLPGTMRSPPPAASSNPNGLSRLHSLFGSNVVDWRRTFRDGMR